LPAFASNKEEAAERCAAGPAAELVGVGERIPGAPGIGRGARLGHARPAVRGNPMGDEPGAPPGLAIHSQPAGAAAEKAEILNVPFSHFGSKSERIILVLDVIAPVTSASIFTTLPGMSSQVQVVTVLFMPFCSEVTVVFLQE